MIKIFATNENDSQDRLFSYHDKKNPVSAANELSNLASIQCVKWHFNGKQVRQFEYNELQPISYVTLSVSLITVQLWNRLDSKWTIACTSFKRKHCGIYYDRKSVFQWHSHKFALHLFFSLFWLFHWNFAPIFNNRQLFEMKTDFLAWSSNHAQC